MTNWAYNRFRFSGPLPAVAEFMSRGFKRETSGADREVLDFDAFLPMPEILKGYDGFDADIGAAILTRGPVRRFGRERDPLTLVETRESGASRHEGLEAWARAHRPHWIEAGERGLRALRETGVLSARQWVSEIWGAAPRFEEFAVVERGPDRVELEFSTPSQAPAGLYRELARRFPAAHVWAAAYEPGERYGYRFEARGEVLDDRRVVLDEALKRDVDGAAYPRKFFSWEQVFPGAKPMSLEEFFGKVVGAALR